MTFTPIDLQTWPRGQMFCYFSKMAPTSYSLTVEVDITNLKKTLKAHNLKFFPTYLWLVTRNLNKQIEFKVAIDDGVTGYYDTLTPTYAAFHQDDKTFSLMWTEYNEDFNQFYKAYIDNQKQHGDTHGVLCQPLTPPPANAYTVSCLPWINFKHFAVHSMENKPYFFPSVEAGKFVEKDGRIIMPLSITCHHATTDGYHVNKFLEDLKEDIDNFGRYITM